MSDEGASDPRDYVLDISALPREPAAAPPGQTPTPDDTLSIFFRCCNVYHRIRLTADQKAYAGHCPRCARAIRVGIDANSRNTGRFFAAE